MTAAQAAALALSLPEAVQADHPGRAIWRRDRDAKVRASQPREAT